MKLLLLPALAVLLTAACKQAPTTPDNQDLVESEESLPVEWTLKIFSADDGSGFNRSANLHIGQHDGRLLCTN